MTQATLKYWEYRLKEHIKLFPTWGNTKSWQDEYQDINDKLKEVRQKVAP